MKGFKFLVMLVLLCLTALGLNSQEARVTNAISSNTGEYEEQISLEIRTWSGQVLLGFTFTNVSGPLSTSDFASEPSFISIMVSGTYSPDDNRTVVVVNLSTTIVNISEGKLKADILKAKFENIFGITLPYNRNYTIGDTVTYVYRIDEPPTIQKFREVFLQHKPSQGFGEMVTPALIGNYVAISFLLKRETGGLLWTAFATVNYPNYFEMNLGQEYTISLRELTGYTEAIHASPEASKSLLGISIVQVDKEFKLISLETIPSQMDKRQGTYLGVTTFMFEKTITGGSVDDLSIHFKIVSPNYIDPTIIAIAIVVIVIAAISGIVGYSIMKRIYRRKC